MGKDIATYIYPPGNGSLTTGGISNVPFSLESKDIPVGIGDVNTTPYHVTAPIHEQIATIFNTIHEIQGQVDVLLRRLVELEGRL